MDIVSHLQPLVVPMVAPAYKNIFPKFYMVLKLAETPFLQETECQSVWDFKHQVPVELFHPVYMRNLEPVLIFNTSVLHVCSL